MKTNGPRFDENSGRYTFSKIESNVELPDLLNVQIDSFKNFLQEDVPPHKRKSKGLQQIFLANFPISDARGNYLLEFAKYEIDKPKYSLEECQERGLTYSVSIKATLRLSEKAEDSDEYVDTIEGKVYLGSLPYMTNRGTFIINGAERVIVSQLHRSPGVFFGMSTHANTTPLYSARIIPFRGSWVEFTTDINNVMFAYIDRKKKFPATTLLRALGYSTDDDILKLFELIEEVKVADIKLNDYLNRKLASDVVDRKTGEIILGKDSILTEEFVKAIKKSEVKKLRFLKDDDGGTSSIIANTLAKDTVRSEEDALEAIYKQLRSSSAPDLETAKI